MRRTRFHTLRGEHLCMGFVFYSETTKHASFHFLDPHKTRHFFLFDSQSRPIPFIPFPRIEKKLTHTGRRNRFLLVAALSLEMNPCFPPLSVSLLEKGNARKRKEEDDCAEKQIQRQETSVRLSL